MNKKQLIVAWVTVILISVFWLEMFRRDTGWLDPIKVKIRTKEWILPVALIGGLLIYTLRDRNK